MEKERLAAFSDGVIAIIITIMVLELKVPHGADWPALRGIAPNFVSYALSFIYLAIYWNNHHHLLHTVAQRRRAHSLGQCRICRSGCRWCRFPPPGSANPLQPCRLPCTAWAADASDRLLPAAAGDPA